MKKKKKKKNSPPIQHQLQAQQALALSHAKVVGRSGTGSYPAPSPDPTAHYFICVYSPRAGTDNPWRTKFWCQQKLLITLPICCQFKKNAFEVWFFTVFYVFFPHVYSPRQGQTTHWGQKFYDNRKAFSLCPYVASFKMIFAKSDFIHIFNDFIHVLYGRATENRISAGSDRFLVCKTNSICIKRIFFGPKKKNTLCGSYTGPITLISQVSNR